LDLKLLSWDHNSTMVPSHICNVCSSLSSSARRRIRTHLRPLLKQGKKEPRSHLEGSACSLRSYQEIAHRQRERLSKLGDSV
jgi:hypothetical protein